MLKFPKYVVRSLPMIGFALMAVLSCAARAEDASDIKTLNEAELGSLCGGYTLANGVDINVGIDNQLFVNGKSIADAQFSLNGTTVSTTSSGQVQVQGNGGTTNVLAMGAVTPTVIQNTANNLTLTQARTITIDVTNMSRVNLQALGAIMSVQSQVINGLRNSIH